MPRPAIDTIKKLDEVSEWNQTKILFFRQDQFLVVAHDFHQKATPDSPMMLLSALDAFRHGIAPLVAAWDGAHRKEMLKRIDTYQVELDAAIEKGKVSYAEFRALKMDMMGLFYYMYACQQMRGLGVQLGKTPESELDMKDLVKE